MRLPRFFGLLRLEFLPPFGGLLRFPPALVELSNPVSRLRQEPLMQRNCRYPLHHAFIPRNQERLRLSVLFLACQASTEHTLAVVPFPAFRHDLFVPFQGLAER